MHAPFDRRVVKDTTDQHSTKRRNHGNIRHHDDAISDPPPYALSLSPSVAATAKVHDWTQQQRAFMKPRQHQSLSPTIDQDLKLSGQAPNPLVGSRSRKLTGQPTSNASHRSTATQSRRDRATASRRDYRIGAVTTDGGASESGMSIVSRFDHRHQIGGQGTAKSARHGATSSSSAARKQARLQTDSPLRAWTGWLERQYRSRHTLLAIVVATTLVVKWAVATGTYSGHLKPPMRGDFEAQRHWIAMTSSSLNFKWLHRPTGIKADPDIVVPMREWYFHDLQYWGLDYPPLTAYHSMVMGAVARLSRHTVSYVTLKPPTELDPNTTSSVTYIANVKAWHQQMSLLERDGGLRHFMRASVVVSDVLVYVTAVLWYCWRNHRGERHARSKSKRNSHALVAIVTVLLQPALILVDHGHFQYNSVMLGLTLWSVNLLQAGNDLLGSILFVCALSFKQMALYYSPAIFAYLLGKCLYRGRRNGLTLFVKLAIVTVGTFVIIFFPFLDSTLILKQVLHRVFPFARGLFEDKVANVWCALNVVIKLRQIATVASLAKIALLATLAAVLPSVVGVLWISYKSGLKNDVTSSTTSSSTEDQRDVPDVPPTIVLLPHALFLSSMAFFLFSFQVHEKSILLPLMPLTLLMGGREAGIGRLDWEWSVLVNNVGMFSMWPLLKRDGLALQYVAILLLWNFAIGYNPFKLRSSFVKILSLITYTLIAAIHTLECIASPPEHLPDLFAVANVGLSVTVFGLSFLWASKRLVQEGWVVAF
ncbi:Glucosyltransferase-like protein [Microbotryomycetes sp. JL221]|nr:Glucosyltransferase-like protein [Microbotryomycetes sp. JL221]